MTSGDLNIDLTSKRPQYFLGERDKTFRLFFLIISRTHSFGNFWEVVGIRPPSLRRWLRPRSMRGLTDFAGTNVIRLRIYCHSIYESF